MKLFPASSAVEIEQMVRSLKAIADLFPGSDPIEIEKSVRALHLAAQSGIASLVERATALLAKTPGESVDKWLSDVGRLKAEDLKQLLKTLNISFKGNKETVINFLRQWVESGGQYTPPDPKEQLRVKAEQYIGDLAERSKRMDPQTAQDILRATEAASSDKALGSEGFKIFANLLGIPVKGTKAKMIDQVKDHVNTILVSRQQTDH